MRYWLMKSEPDEFSIDDLARAPDQRAPWFGVRSYQARNFMRDMKLGELAFFYHSSCPEPGIAGIAKVCKLAYPDASQFDSKSPYFDAKSKRDAPRWFNVDVQWVETLRFVALAELREQPALSDMVTLRRGNRLSITPVSAGQWRYIVQLAKTSTP